MAAATPPTTTSRVETGRRTSWRIRDHHVHAVFGFALLLILGAASLLPLLWMVSTSLKTTNALYVFPPQLIPDDPTLENYRKFFARDGLTYARNSVIVSVSVTLIVVLTSAMAGYALAKIPFPGRHALFLTLLTGLMIPFEVVLIPLFVIIVKLEVANTFLGIILPMCASPFGIFVMRNFLLSMPNDLLDAARIDGDSEFGIFWRIVLPLSRPALAALSTIIFITSWSAFLWPLLASSSKETRTLPVAVSMANQLGFSANYGMMMAAATVTFVPALIIYLLFQRYFIEGITMTGLKG
ncbi:MAG: carbohydrate ABC transporter permease [Thermomicrobiales bacterium]|nr:carbohydrate ABC transporter permease [Thermomicrobiales bacterium]